MMPCSNCYKEENGKLIPQRNDGYKCICGNTIRINNKEEPNNMRGKLKC